MFNISRMLSIRFGEKLFFMHFLSSTNPTADVLLSTHPCSVECHPVAHRLQLQLDLQLHQTVFNNCKFEMLLTFYLYFSPTPPLWRIYIFEIMSVFNYQNQYKNSSMLLDVKSRLIMHYVFKCTFLPSFYIIKIFLKITSRQGV